MSDTDLRERQVETESETEASGFEYLRINIFSLLLTFVFCRFLSFYQKKN